MRTDFGYYIKGDRKQMGLKQVSLTVSLLVAVDHKEDAYLIDEAIEQILNEAGFLRLENDNAALIKEALVQTEDIEECDGEEEK